MNKAIFAILVSCLPVTANAFSGSDLLSQCREFVKILEGENVDLKQTLNAGLCGGYVHGIQEGFDAASELAYLASEDQGTAPVSGKYWNVPDDVQAEQIVKIVVRYLEINSEMQTRPAVLSVINALIQTYPAKKPTR